MLVLMRVRQEADASLTHVHQAVASHRTWTCTTRRATAGPGILQASGKLVIDWLLRRWRLDWFSLLEARQVRAYDSRTFWLCRTLVIGDDIFVGLRLAG